ncbi:MAG TPA: HDIG domain-containing protein [Petrotogaceae bacterium]|nr:HDIG domain-containing protein [Petrotogaceae bacterium]HQC41158.1 HDIG domain-containing protein [Petrotogaceae bacterium]
MKTPDRKTAHDILNQASEMNPGKWIEHSKNTAYAAEKIARHIKGLDREKAYTAGLLHDIGRREGVRNLHHIICGYEYMMSLEYDGTAKISMTHSFALKNLNTYLGEYDCTDAELDFIRTYIENVQYDDYDLLIQLCDCLALADGLCIIEQRLVDVAMRYGFNELTIPKWKKIFEIKTYFEKIMGTSIYDVLGIMPRQMK